MSSKKYDLTITPHGLGIILLFIIFACISTAPIYVIIEILINIKNDNLIRNILLIILMIIVLIGIAFAVRSVLKKGTIKFNGTKINIEGGDFIWHSIKTDCSNINSFEINKSGIIFIINGKKKSFNPIQFSKKQIIQILNEIKKRGGLENQEISLEKKRST